MPARGGGVGIRTARLDACDELVLQFQRRAAEVFGIDILPDISAHIQCRRCRIDGVADSASSSPQRAGNQGQRQNSWPNQPEGGAGAVWWRGATWSTRTPGAEIGIYSCSPPRNRRRRAPGGPGRPRRMRQIPDRDRAFSCAMRATTISWRRRCGVGFGDHHHRDIGGDRGDIFRIHDLQAVSGAQHPGQPRAI